MLEWKDREADGEGNLGKERWEGGVAGKVRKSLLVWLEAAKRRESKCIQQPPAPAQDQDKKPSTSGPAPAQSGRLSRGSAQRRPLAASADQRATHFSLTCPDHPTMRASICSLRQHQHTTYAFRFHRKWSSDLACNPHIASGLSLASPAIQPPTTTIDTR